MEGILFLIREGNSLDALDQLLRKDRAIIKACSSDALLQGIDELDVEMFSLALCHMWCCLLEVEVTARSHPTGRQSDHRVERNFAIVCRLEKFLWNAEVAQLIYCADIFTSVIRYIVKLARQVDQCLRLVQPMKRITELWRSDKATIAAPNKDSNLISQTMLCSAWGDEPLDDTVITSVEQHFFALCRAADYPTAAAGILERSVYRIDPKRLLKVEDYINYCISGALIYVDFGQWKRADTILKYALRCPIPTHLALQRNAFQIRMLVSSVWKGKMPNDLMRPIPYDNRSMEERWNKLADAIKHDSRPAALDALANEQLNDDIQNAGLSKLANLCIEAMKQREIVCIASVFSRISLTNLSQHLTDFNQAPISHDQSMALLLDLRRKNLIDFSIDEENNEISFELPEQLCLPGGNLREPMPCLLVTELLEEKMRDVQNAARVLERVSRELHLSDDSSRIQISRSFQSQSSSMQTDAMRTYDNLDE